MRRRARTRAPPSRPSSPSRGGSARRSCRVSRRETLDPCRTWPYRISVTVYRSFAEFGDEHRRNVLQKVFRCRFIKNLGVLFQLVSHLVNEETAAWREGLVGFF